MSKSRIGMIYKVTALVPSNKPKLQVYLDENLLKEGKRLAEKRQRSLSSLVRRLLQLEIEKALKNGELKVEVSDEKIKNSDKPENETDNNNSDDSEE